MQRHFQGSNPNFTKKHPNIIGHANFRPEEKIRVTADVDYEVRPFPVAILDWGGNVCSYKYLMQRQRTTKHQIESNDEDIFNFLNIALRKLKAEMMDPFEVEPTSKTGLDFEVEREFRRYVRLNFESRKLEAIWNDEKK